MAQLPVKAIGHQYAWFWFKGIHDGYNYFYQAEYWSEGRNHLTSVMPQSFSINFTREEVVDFIIQFDIRARRIIGDTFGVRMYKEEP